MVGPPSRAHASVSVVPLARGAACRRSLGGACWPRVYAAHRLPSRSGAYVAIWAVSHWFRPARPVLGNARSPPVLSVAGLGGASAARGAAPPAAYRRNRSVCPVGRPPAGAASAAPRDACQPRPGRPGPRASSPRLRASAAAGCCVAPCARRVRRAHGANLPPAVKICCSAREWGAWKRPNSREITAPRRIGGALRLRRAANGLLLGRCIAAGAPAAAAGTLFLPVLG